MTEEPEEVITLDEQPKTEEKPLAPEKKKAEEKAETKSEAKAESTSATAESDNLFGNSLSKPTTPATPAKKKGGRLFDKIGEKFNSALQNIMDSDGKEEVGDLFGDDAF